jgi:hypothetical protein
MVGADGQREEADEQIVLFINMYTVIKKFTY